MVQNSVLGKDKVIVVNGRNLGVHTTGVQRYTKKIVENWRSGEYQLLAPDSPRHGFSGHLWEQFVLPFRVPNNGLLWSPSNTGPISMSNQVVTIHDVVPYDLPETLNPKFVAWYQFIQPKLVKRAAHIITISEFSKDRILDVFGVAENKVSVIYNGVDLPREDLASLPSDITIPYERYVLAVGSLEPRKNIKRLISAWLKIVDLLPEDIGLVLVGAKGINRVFLDSGLQSEAQLASNRIFFTGHVSDNDLSVLYKNAVLFCYPSLYEGFGLPPLEAMSYGIPVITSNTTAMAEICHGAAILVDPFDVDCIADAIQKQVRSIDHSLASAGKHLAQQLNWELCATKTFALLKNYS